MSSVITMTLVIGHVFRSYYIYFSALRLTPRRLAMSSALPLTRPAWQDRLATLPGSPNHIPAFFFAHGSPVLTFSNDPPNPNPLMRALVKNGGKESPQADFLRDFGPALLAKYQPKGILVFSAHWETEGDQLGGSLFRTRVNLCCSIRNTVTDYGEENPLLMDYYNFSPDFYQLKFSSRGDAQLSQRVVELFHEVL
jgi:hypothetical protein